MSFLAKVKAESGDVYHGEDLAAIHGIVRGHLVSAKFKNAIEAIKKDILKEIKRELEISKEAMVRRDFDGVTQLDWLIQTMIGEHLSDGKINL